MTLKNKLLKKIESKNLEISVVGLGYVGLPIALLFANAGFRVMGIARNIIKVENINNGNSEFKSLNNNLRKAVSKNKFHARIINEFDFSKSDIVIICLPTPIDTNKKPDISALLEIRDKLEKIDLTGKLIINESTVAPYSTEKIFGNFKSDYFLACSPERVDPGVGSNTVESIPKLLGAYDKESLALANALYKTILRNKIIEVPNMQTAEMSKMLENTYRAVNIALINEFAILADKIDIDILNVIKAASTKWSFQSHYPGIGVGGHCIPVDPYYLLDMADSNGIKMSVTKNSLSTNENMPGYLFNKVEELREKNDKILVYGLSYKKNVPDIRESPAIFFCELLKSKNIKFQVYDPYIDSQIIKILGYEEGKLEKYDLVIVATDHDSLKSDSTKIISKKIRVIDGKNYFKTNPGAQLNGVGRKIC